MLHLFLRARAGVDTEAVTNAVKSCQADDHQVVTFAVLGHKADLGVMAVGPDLWRLRLLQTELTSAGLELVHSYLSLTEVSEYAEGMPPERLEPRLHPRLPPAGKPVVCFYPMSKRRAPGQNWYALSLEERSRLMYSHGLTGRQYAGKIQQVVCGAIGLDEWEWGVTLFAKDPLEFKNIVTEMRFDEASAQYAEFGRFYVGKVAQPEEWLAAVG